MSDSEMLDYPFGIVRLDRAGTVNFFNPAEGRMVHKSAQEVIGRNFFRDVAPCTAVKEFQGRFQDFIETVGGRSEVFSFFYRYSEIPYLQVAITMVKRPDDPKHVYIVVDAHRDGALQDVV